MQIHKNVTLVASARTDRNGVIVDGRTYYCRVEKTSWYGLTKSEFTQKVIDDIKAKYEDVMVYQRKKASFEKNKNYSCIPRWKR